MNFNNIIASYPVAVISTIHSGKAYSLSDAFAASDRWCTYKMYKLVVEGRSWGGKALDQI